MKTICTLIVIATVCLMTTAFVYQAGSVIGGAIDTRITAINEVER